MSSQSRQHHYPYTTSQQNAVHLQQNLVSANTLSQQSSLGRLESKHMNAPVKKPDANSRQKVVAGPHGVPLTEVSLSTQ
jgi:hypothetical protein